MTSPAYTIINCPHCRQILTIAGRQLAAGFQDADCPRCGQPFTFAKGSMGSPAVLKRQPQESNE